MSVNATGDTAASVKNWSFWFLGIASLVAILVFAVFAWIDSRKVPTIVFYGTPSSEIAVDIRGAVTTPGVVLLQPGDRMIDVITAAGGFAPEADVALVNMSSRVRDGQMVMIPTQLPDIAEQTDNLININTASVAELDQLPGIGTVRAQQIIDFRTANGPFLRIEDLERVDGISPNLVETLRPYIRVSGDD